MKHVLAFFLLACAATERTLAHVAVHPNATLSKGRMMMKSKSRPSNSTNIKKADCRSQGDSRS